MLQHETIPQPAPICSVLEQSENHSGSTLASDIAQAAIHMDKQNVPNVSLTPQEFAQAVAEAEAEHVTRPGAERQTTRVEVNGQAFTVNASSEELLAQVQSHCTVESGFRGMWPRGHKGPSRGRSFVSSVIVVGLAFQMYVCVREYQHLGVSQVNQEAIRALPADMQADASNLHPLSQIIDNQLVYARYSDIAALAQGKSYPAQILVADQPGTNTAGEPQWMLLQSSGHYFVRGWRYTGEEGYEAYTGWLSSIAAAPNIQKTHEVPVERFREIAEPPSIVQDADGTGEQVYLPDTP